MPYKDPAKARARRRNRENARRATASDVTAEQEAAMRRKTRKCPMPGCGVWMTGKPHLPNSKELDHILPINQGGTHTHGNVRIICRRCNQSRPKDGSDYRGTLSLWAEDPAAVARAHKEMCAKGLHARTPANQVSGGDGKQRCRPCRREQLQKRVQLQECRCGAKFPAPGRTRMCPGCTLAAAHAAAYLHGLFELGWSEIAPLVGYTTAEGVRYAAKRIGYTTVPKPAVPKPARLCGHCGTPMPAGGRPCQTCTTARAWRAVELRQEGWTLRMIADELGYASITSVTNLMGTVVPDPARDRPVSWWPTPEGLVTGSDSDGCTSVHEYA